MRRDLWTERFEENGRQETSEGSIAKPITAVVKKGGKDFDGTSISVREKLEPVSVRLDRRANSGSRGLPARNDGSAFLGGKIFLDIGSGSGLFSLAAKNLGARVHSFDYDENSVACTLELNNRYHPETGGWTVERGSALDEISMMSLDQFDIVYSWGVLHHTGDMWRALNLAQKPTKPGGLLFIAPYNDQGVVSAFWTKMKRAYNSGPLGKVLMTALFVPYFFLPTAAAGIVRHGIPWGEFGAYKRKRGILVYHDWIDWIGGYPFETAKPEDICEFYQKMDLSCKRWPRPEVSGKTNSYFGGLDKQPASWREELCRRANFGGSSGECR